MADSIETLVAKLQAEGVEAGQQAAAKLQSEAEQQAEAIEAEARAGAEKIIADAKAEAESTVARSKTDLELAARDVVMGLRQTLNQALTAVLAQAVKEPLGDAEFLKGLIHELALEYGKADIEGMSTVKLRLTPEMMGRLADWAIGELHEKALGEGVTLDLKGRLRQAGFEYSVTGGTVEVTEDSVTSALAGLVGPSLRELFDQAADGKGE